MYVFAKRSILLRLALIWTVAWEMDGCEANGGALEHLLRERLPRWGWEAVHSTNHRLSSGEHRQRTVHVQARRGALLALHRSGHGHLAGAWLCRLKRRELL